MGRDAGPASRESGFTCLSARDASVSPGFSIGGLDDREATVLCVGEGDPSFRSPEIEAVVEVPRVGSGLELERPLLSAVLGLVDPVVRPSPADNR